MPDLTITEDTLPPEADAGIRRLVIEDKGHRTVIIVQVRQETRLEDCPGEIHPAERFDPIHQVVTNQQLVNACLAIAKTAVNAPRQYSIES